MSYDIQNNEFRKSHITLEPPKSSVRIEIDCPQTILNNVCWFRKNLLSATRVIVQQTKWTTVFHNKSMYFEKWADKICMKRIAICCEIKAIK